MTRLATIRLDNATLFDRDEPSFFSCTVPLERGAVFPGDGVRLENGEPCEFVPFGALWDDGSYRTVLVRGWTTMPAHTRKELVVEQGPPTPLPASALDAIAAAHFPLTNDAATWSKGTLESMPSSDRTEDHMHWRTPDGELVLDLRIEIAPSGSHLYWQFTACWSNPANPAPQWTQAYPLELSVPQGMLLSCHWGAQKGVSAVGPNLPALTAVHGEKLTLLPAGTVWGDGQMHCWRGAVLVRQTPAAFAALQTALLAIATDESWRSSRAWGPFGAVPAKPYWWPMAQACTDWVLRGIERRDLAPAVDPWYEQRYGLRKVPGSTGDQMDFGLMNCMAAVITGEPLAIDLYMPDALQDSCRPTHFYEQNGAMVLAANHPQLVLWDQRPHFNAGVSLDRLGKSAVGSFESHGWWGRDNQHWSSNLLCSLYYLTGDPQLRILIDHECETFLSQQRLPIPPLRPGWPTTGPDAARAVGRTLGAGAWLYMCTGRADIRKRLVDRVDLSILPAWSGRSVDPAGARPFMLMQTDGRQAPIPVGSQAWFPWQEGIAVAGLEACYRVTGHQPARDLAKELARTLAEYGWQWRASYYTDAQVANCIVWNSGNDVNRDDPLVFQPADDTDFALWVQVATMLSADLYSNSSYAATLRNIVARRYGAPPTDGGPGRYSQWTTIEQPVAP